jgi:acetyl-CoA acetyltransferase
MHNIAIVGVYNTKQGRVLEGETSESLALDAIRGVLNDAGLKPSDINGVCGNNNYGGPSAAQMIRLLGSRPSWVSTGSNIPGILEAATAIGSGMCDTAVIFAAQAGAYSDRARTAPWTRPSNEFVEWTGLYTAAEFALMAKRHMYEYGTKPEALAEVASAVRTNGARNPHAVYFGRECTPEDVLNSRMVADPFHLLDCCTTTEGGAAMILTAVDRARGMNVQPVYILGGATEQQGLAYNEAPVWSRYGWSGRWGGQRTFAMAGLEPKDIDICEFYDNFSFEIIRLVETYGFCGEGEGGDFVMGGRIRLDGELPICTDGGLMGFSHAGMVQGLQRVISGVQQIQGRHVNQVRKPVKHVLCENFGSAALLTEQMIISSESPV